MFVRRNARGELVAVGSIHHARLAQLQAADKKSRKSSAKAAEPVSEPTPDVEAQASDVPEPPAHSDLKADWVAYAVKCGADPDEAENTTKADLIELYGDSHDD